MKKKLINGIVQVVFDTTISGNLKWIECSYGSDSRKIFESESEDKLTRFTIEVNMNENGSIGKSGAFTINNNNLLNNKIYIYGDENRNVKKIQQILFETHFIQSISRSLDQEKTLNQILNNIDASYSRNEKLENLLDTNRLRKIYNKLTSIFKI